MGAWGTRISSNDTYADIYEQFIDLYNDGLSVAEITERLINENQETISLKDDAPNFWFALATGQWECKALDIEIFSKVEHLINSGEDLKIWKESDATPADLKAREKALNKFLLKLQTEKDIPKRRTKKRFYNSIYQKGNCLTYLMDNGNYGGAFVLTDEQQTETGTNYIAITTINKSTKPTLEDFKKAEVYVKRVEEIDFSQSVLTKNWVDQPQIGAFSAMIKNNGIQIEIIGNITIYREYKIIKDKVIGFGWIVLKSEILFRGEYIKINGKAKTRLKLSEWTKKH
jgi:hypothetical protein